VHHLFNDLAEAHPLRMERVWKTGVNNAPLLQAIPLAGA